MPPGMAQAQLAGQRLGPDTVDGIAPAQDWQNWWQSRVRERRNGAPWVAALAPA
jgi:hypothetical protein